MTPDDPDTPDSLEITKDYEPLSFHSAPPAYEVSLVERTPDDPFDMGSDEGPDGEEVWRFKFRGAEPLGDPKPGLIEKLCKARIAIAEKGVVPKSGYNSHIQHEYSTYDDVNGHISVPLAENGIWVHSSMVDTYKQPSGKTKGGNQRYCVTAVMEVYLTDGESRIGRRVIGENENAGDKHHYALESQLLRYALSKMLLLESGDVEVDQEDQSTTTNSQASKGKTQEKKRWVFVPDDTPKDPSRVEDDSPWTWDEDEGWFWAFLTENEAEREKKSRSQYGVIGQADKGGPDGVD